MQCEVCGRWIAGKGYRRIIDGARMIVCERCSKFGKPDFSSEVKRPTSKSVKLPVKRRKVIKSPLDENEELVENYNELIKKARIEMGLSHEDLGRRVGEKTSTLKKIESGKIIPDKALTRKLEHELHIKLLVKRQEPKITELPQPPIRELTLGDIVKLKVKKEDSSERGR